MKMQRIGDFIVAAVLALAVLSIDSCSNDDGPRPGDPGLPEHAGAFAKHRPAPHKT